VRVAFAPNDERTAKRLSDALGTATELKRQKHLSGRRFAVWLSHLGLSEQETPRPLLTAGEILQLPPDEALVLVSGVPPIRARKLKYYTDRNFLARCLPAPARGNGRAIAARQRHADDWTGHTRAPHPQLERAWSELISSSAGRLPEHAPDLEMARDARSETTEEQAPEHGADPGRAATHDDDDDLIR
jgi:type IV secretion system protein VirD4